MLVLVIPVLVLVLVLVLLLVLLPVLLASRAAPRTRLVLLFLLVLVPHVRRRRAQQQTTLCWLSFPAKTVLGEPICVSPLSLPPRFKLPAGQEAHWHACRAWREFRAKLFSRAPQASADGGSRYRQSRRSRAQPPFPGEGAMANSWGQLPSITAEMRHRASSHCTR